MSQGWGMSQGEAGNDEEGEADGVHVLWPTPDAQVPRRMAGMQVLPISVLPTLCLCRWSKSAILCE